MKAVVDYIISLIIIAVLLYAFVVFTTPEIERSVWPENVQPIPVMPEETP